MLRYIGVLITGLTLGWGIITTAEAQGPYAAQVQAAIRQLLAGSYAFANGTALNPTIRFAIDTDRDSGIYGVAEDDLGLSVNGGLTFRVRPTELSMYGVLHFPNDNTYDIGSSNGTGRPAKLHLGNPAVTVGADVTVLEACDVPTQRYLARIVPATGGATNCATAFAAAALTADCTVATLKAGQKLVDVHADVTVGFTCSGTCTGTKVVQCGTAAGGTQVLAAGFNVAATGVAGDADAELGSGMTRAAAIQGGLLGSWSSTTPISCRFTSGTGNWGNGSATFVNAGSITFTLVTEQIK